jgi:hypothetical protein
MRLRRPQFGMLLVALALALTPHSASAEASPVECGIVDVQYDVAANLRISGTTMGAGDGVHRVGPGAIVLRFDRRPGGGSVKLLTYDLRERFAVEAKALFWTTRVTTDVKVGASRSSRSVVAEGSLLDHTLRWDGKANGFRSDGTLTCDGSMCGQFGAPPSGKSEVHLGPSSIELKPFEFAADMKTFSMPYALVSESDSPSQRTQVAIAGREVRRACSADDHS